MFFHTILLSSTIQTLARRHHLPCFSPSVTSNRVNATNRVNAASLFFSFGYVKKTENKRKKRKKENKRERIEPENKQKKERNLLTHLGRFKEGTSSYVKNDRDETTALYPFSFLFLFVLWFYPFSFFFFFSFFLFLFFLRNRRRKTRNRR